VNKAPTLSLLLPAILLTVALLFTVTVAVFVTSHSAVAQSRPDPISNTIVQSRLITSRSITPRSIAPRSTTPSEQAHVKPARPSHLRSADEL
jgi:hypothetical protein